MPTHAIHPPRAALGWIAFALSIGSVAGQIERIEQGNWTEIAHATGNGWMQFPRALGFDHVRADVTGKRILVDWQTNADVIQFPTTSGWMGSDDAGVTWNAPGPSETAGLDLMVALRRRDGVVVSIPYYPQPNLAGGRTKFPFTYHTSADNGMTWTAHVADAPDGGLVNSVTPITGFRFHRGMLEDDDGSLYLPAYLSLTGDNVHRAAVLKSTDGGRVWTFLSTIRATTDREYNETAIVRCADNTWLAVSRNHIGSAAQALAFSRSIDRGKSWEALPAPPGIRATAGVDPTLLLLPNGVLVLSYGEHRGSAGRDVHLALSADGAGHAWTDLTTFTGVSGKSESTGYTSLVALDAHRFIQISDTGGNAYYSSQHPTPNPFSIRTKSVNVVLARQNRIDLRARYAAQALAVDTDLTQSIAGHPETRVSGAFDGSADYWSGAFKAGTSGRFVIDLRQPCLLTALGLCLQPGVPESAVVRVSEDNVTWSAPVKTYSSAVHLALDYTNFAQPVRAQFVAIEVSGPGPYVSLNEIELYGPPAPSGDAFLANISLRVAASASRPLIAGFVTSGGTQELLVRAIGPGLAPYVAPNTTLAGNPRLTLFDSTSNAFATNDDWSGDTRLVDAAAQVGAFPLAANSTDAALLVRTTGVNTAHLTAASDGIGLLEIYATGAGAGQLANLSGRYRVSSGTGTLIAGFVLAGNGAKTLLIRGVGPTLAAAPFGLTGTLADPKVEIFDASGNSVAANDTWPAELAGAFAQAGAFPLSASSKDAALLVTLPAGAYTAHLTAADNVAGEGLLEIYALPDAGR